VLSVLYMACALVTLFFKPAWAPIESAGSPLRRIKDLLSAWEVVALFGVSIGGLYAGWFSPTEAAGVGAFSALALGFARGGLSRRALIECFADTIRTTCMLFLIVMSAFVFSYFVVQTQLPGVLVGWIDAWHLGPIEIIVLMMIFYIIMGCFLDGGGMVLITVPIFLPVVVQAGYDPVWFGVMLVVVVELGLIHPPVGMNIFVIQARVPDVPILRVYQGIVPFLAAPMVLLAILVAWPRLALWLPKLLYG